MNILGKTKVVGGVAVAAALLAAGGCANKDKKADAAPGSVEEIRQSHVPPAPPPMPVQPVAVQPVAVQPVVADTSPVVTTPSVASASGNVYTVQKGDTLTKIARAKYGDPSAVRKIKEANPGVDPNLIKPGQRINLP